MEQLKVAVITPTINSDTLAKCLVSVRDQTYQNLTHYIFIDGGGHEDMVRKRLFKTSTTPKTKTIVLEENIDNKTAWTSRIVVLTPSRSSLEMPLNL